MPPPGVEGCGAQAPTQLRSARMRRPLVELPVLDPLVAEVSGLVPLAPMLPELVSEPMAPGVVLGVVTGAEPGVVVVVVVVDVEGFVLLPAPVEPMSPAPAPEVLELGGLVSTPVLLPAPMLPVLLLTPLGLLGLLVSLPAPMVPVLPEGCDVDGEVAGELFEGEEDEPPAPPELLPWATAAKPMARPARPASRLRRRFEIFIR